MSKIIVRRQEYANNGTHANEIESVVKQNLIVNTLSSALDVAPSVGLVKNVKDGIEDTNLFKHVQLINPELQGDLNIDLIDAEFGYIYRVRSDINQGTFPSEAGNAGLLIGYSQVRNNKVTYGSQVMLTFRGNGIYKRTAGYNASGSTWSNWTAI